MDGIGSDDGYAEIVLATSAWEAVGMSESVSLCMPRQRDRLIQSHASTRDDA